MRKLKLFFACLLMAVLGIGNVWAAPDESVTFSAQGYSNQQAVSSYNGTDFSIAFDKGTNSNAPKYYTSGSAIRAYGGNTMTISSSTKTIKEIAITFGSSDGSNAITTDVATYANGTWTGSASSVTFTIGGSSGNRRLSAIAITYATGGTTTPSLSVAPTSIDFGTVEQGASVSSEVVAVTFANLTGSVTYSGLSGAFSATGNIAATGDEITIAANTSNVGEYEQTLTVQSTADALSKTVTVTMNVVEPFDGLELTFPDYNDNGVGSYTATWTATKGGQVWTMANFNNNNSGWNLIKAGRNNSNASVATITTQVANPVESVVVTVSSVVAANVNSHKLYVADNAEFTDAIEIDGDPATIAAGDITYTIPAANRAEDLYYKLEYDLAAGSGNGFLQISKLAYAYGTAAPQKQNTGLAYATANYLVKAGASLAPELTNPNSLTGITYASSDADIVAVDENTGALTIKAVGKAVITASRAEDETYKVGSASYTIFVAEQAGTAEDPLTEASAKALIDLDCALTVHVNGLVLSQNTTNFTVTLTDGFQFYKAKDLNNVAFESAYLAAGDEVTAVGQLTKYSSTYELADGCYLTFYEQATAPLTSIANDKDHPYTVAQALAFAAAPTTYDLADHVYIQGVVYKANSFNSTNGTYNIYIKDAGTSEDDGKFEFYKCAGLYQVGEDAVPFAEGGVQEGDEVIGYGVMTYYSGGSIWEFGQPNQLVSLNRPAVAVTGVELNKESTSLEVGETETLVATVAPENATNKAVTWASDDETVATVENGVVTAVAAGTATITVTTTDGSFTDDCEVTVTAADPTKHIVTFDATVDKTTENTELSITKSNVTIAITTGDGRFNNETDYRPYKNSVFTVSCSAGNITKIEFTCASGNTASGFADAEGLDKTNSVWTGNAESVSFTASNAQVRIQQLVVTYKEDNRAAAELAWDLTDDIEITVKDAFSAPALLNPNSIDAAEITIESSNTDVATVSEGVVSLVANATGTTTITATFAGNASYKPATVSYNITVNEAGLDNVTFDAAVDVAETNEKSITKAGFTLTFTDGALDNGENYRLYKGQTMTLSSTDYLIKKIEFTCTSGNPITGFADAAGLDKDNNEWTGESSTVELTATNNQVRMTKIKVYYVDDTRAAAGLAWDPAEDITLTVGDAFSAPALLNPNSIDAAEITIESSKTTVATVSEGVVSLVENATGTTTITATFAGNATYKPATVSYKITVNPAYAIYVSPSLNVNFGSVEQDAEVADKKVTVSFTNVPAATLTLAGDGASAFTISPAAAMTESGDITISASSANVGTFAATLTISDDANNATSKVVNLSITVNEVVIAETPVATDSKWVAATEVVDGMQVLIVGVNGDKAYAAGIQNTNNRAAVEGSLDGEGAFTPGDNTMAFTVIEQPDGTFALQTSNDKYLYAASSSSNYLRSQDELDDNGRWTLTIDGAVANGSNTRNTMQFNSGSSCFACYGSASQKPIALYIPYVAPEQPEEPNYEIARPDLTAGWYYTMCLDKAVTHVKGGSIWRVLSKAANGTDVILEEAEMPLAAGRPYIFYATAANLEVAYTGEAVGAPVTEGNNGLVGSFVQAQIDNVNTNYIIYNNQLYFVNSDNVYVGANRAYLNMLEVPSYNNSEPQVGNAPRRRVTMAVNGAQVATGMEDIQPSEISIQKVMINGELFILRGEKMFDATGRLVK